jgi:hypothetical protein
LRARSPILGGRFAVSVLREAARFLVKRGGGERGFGGSEILSGKIGFKEPQRPDSVELLTGDRGVSRVDEHASVVSVIMYRKHVWYWLWT